MVDLLTRHETPKNQKYALTELLQDNLWDVPEVKKIIEGAGYTSESLLAKAINKERDIIQKNDHLIALRVKTLGQLQQSYEALVHRPILQERLKLQNELLKRDLQAIDVSTVQSLEVANGNQQENNGRGKPKAKSGQ
jgi:hypothetical protein